MRSLLLIDDAQWLAMEPATLDALVTKAVEGGKAEILWQRLLRVKTKNARPMTKAALALARSRVYLPTSQETARLWLIEAQSEAEPTPLGDVFDIAELQARIDKAPEVVDGRFAPDACSLGAFKSECWVRCPRCGGAGIINDVRALCFACAYSSQQAGWYQTRKGQLTSVFNLPLLLKTTIAPGEVWAYNNRHLNQLRCYVEATLRDERNNTGRSWSHKLPAWMKSAKNREKVLRALDVLKKIAADSGLV